MPPKSSKSNTEPRFTRSGDEEIFRERGIVDDGEVGPLPLKLVRIFYEDRGAFHWGFLWSAFRRTSDGALEEHGWHVVDCQNTTADNASLTFRHQHKEPDATTAEHWDISLLVDNVPSDVRVYLIGFGETYVNAGGNCITCICDVVKEMVELEVLPQSAVQALQAARAEDMADPKKRPYHIAGAF